MSIIPTLPSIALDHGLEMIAHVESLVRENKAKEAEAFLKTKGDTIPPALRQDILSIIQTQPKDAKKKLDASVTSLSVKDDTLKKIQDYAQEYFTSSIVEGGAAKGLHQAEIRPFLAFNNPTGWEYCNNFYPYIQIIQNQIFLQAKAFLTEDKFKLFEERFLQGLKNFITTNSTDLMAASIEKYFLNSIVNQDGVRETYDVSKKHMNYFKNIRSTTELFLNQTLGMLNSPHKKFLFETPHSLALDTLPPPGHLAYAAYTSLTNLRLNLKYFTITVANIQNSFKPDLVIKPTGKDWSFLDGQNITDNFKKSIITQSQDIGSKTMAFAKEYMWTFLNLMPVFDSYCKDLETGDLSSFLDGDINPKILNKLKKKEVHFNGLCSKIEEYFDWLVTNANEAKRLLTILVNRDMFLQCQDLHQLEQELTGVEPSLRRKTLDNKIEAFGKALTTDGSLAKKSVEILRKDQWIQSLRKVLSPLITYISQIETAATALLTIPLRTTKQLSKWRSLEHFSDPKQPLSIENFLALAQYKKIEFAKGAPIETYVMIHNLRMLAKETNNEDLAKKLKNIEARQQGTFIIANAEPKDKPVLLAIKRFITSHEGSDEEEIIEANLTLPEVDSALKRIEETLSKQSKSSKAFSVDLKATESEKKAESEQINHTAIASQTEKKEQASQPTIVKSEEELRQIALREHLNKHLLALNATLKSSFSDLMHLFKKAIGAKESLDDAQDHVQNLITLMNRLFAQIAGKSSKNDIFATIASSISEGSLAMEQLLQGIDLFVNRVKTSKDLPERLTHELKRLLDANVEHLIQKGIKQDDITTIIGTSRGEIACRDVANFAKTNAWNHRLTSARKILAQAYQWTHNEKGAIQQQQVLNEICEYYQNIIQVTAKIALAYSTIGHEDLEELLEKQYNDLDEVFTFYKTSLQEGTKAVSVTVAEQSEIQRKTLAELESYKKAFTVLQANENSDFFSSSFDNLLKNNMCRLISEVERQSYLTENPKEFRLNYATILNLVYQTAEELLKVLLVSKDPNVDLGDFGHDLAAMMKALGVDLKKCSPGLQDFLQKGQKAKNMLRYFASSKAFYGDVDEKSEKIKSALHKASKLSHKKGVSPGDDKDSDFIVAGSEDTHKAQEWYQKEALNHVLLLGELIALFR